MAAAHFLAFDLGAESGRALLGTLDHGRLTLQERHRFHNPSCQLGRHLYWNVLAQWDQLKVGLHKSASDTRLDALGIDTWGVDFALIGPAGELLANPFHYRDSRTDGMMDRAFERVGREQIFQVTGIQFMQINTLFQLLAMKLAQPHLLQIARTMLFMPDLFNYLFTGRQACEYSIASTSQMLDAHTGQWATDLLKALDLPVHLLPQIVPPGTIIGTLTDTVADECGVSPLPVIAPACHDTASAVAAVPAEGDDWCYLSSGTWSLMGVELPGPIINPQALRYNYTNEGGVGRTIRFLKNIMGLWLVQECRRHWADHGQEYSYAELTQLAEQAPAFISLIDPNDSAFLSPGQMPQKIQQFCQRTGQPILTTPAQIVRTCLESLALAYRRTLEGLEDVLGKRIGTIHIVGGGANNALLNQMTADATGRTVLAGPVEATAIGNILVQAMALGHISSIGHLRQIVRDSFPVTRYEPQNPSPWQQAYDRFRQLVA